MKIVSIVGARPEFVQVAMLARVLRREHQEILVHTGQHYDDRMSDRFFRELDIPTPDVHLNVGPLDPSSQTGEMLAGIAEVLREHDPDLVVVRGDTTSTLAGTLAAKQLLYPLVHVEGGMRSFDRTMPEEINRIVADHVADVALVTDEGARARLAHEGITQDVHVVGDVMYDVFLKARARALALPRDPRVPAAYDLLTLHRAENVDDRDRLAAIVAGLADAPRPIVFPMHPRTATRLRAFGIPMPAGVVAVEPLGYLEIVALELGATKILTDSGGVAREAYFAGVRAITLRDSTEWTNTVEAGWNVLAGGRTAAIRRALQDETPPPAEHPPLFGDGRAAEHILRALESPRTREIAQTARDVRGRRAYAAALRSATMGATDPIR